MYCLLVKVDFRFYVETAGLSLDEIDRVFAIKYASTTKMTYQEATRLAKQELETERLNIRRESTTGDNKDSSDHLEKIV